MATTKGWMQGNPFSPHPGRTRTKKPLPEGFEAAFGRRPKWSDYYEGHGKFSLRYPEFKVLLVQWETELRAFRGFGFPPGVTVDNFASSAEVFAF